MACGAAVIYRTEQVDVEFEFGDYLPGPHSEACLSSKVFVGVTLKVFSQGLLLRKVKQHLFEMQRLDI